MSAIQIVCAVAVPLLWGYQFVAIKVGVTEFPPLFFLALRFLAIALLLIPFVKRPARQQFGPLPSWGRFCVRQANEGVPTGGFRISKPKIDARGQAQRLVLQVADDPGYSSSTLPSEACRHFD
jgi:hypothetical protein